VETPVRRRIGEIQWLRAVAALMVMVAHLQVEIALNHFGVAPNAVPTSPFPFTAGVDIFFVISGFVMAHASGGLYGRTGAWRSFLVRRLARVVPLYWLVTLLLLALMASLQTPPWLALTPWQLVSSFLFLPALDSNGLPFPIFTLGWTLNYEMLFYVVFALFVGWPRRIALNAVCAAIVALVIAGRVWPIDNVAVRFWTDGVVLEFVGGILLQRAVARGLVLPGVVRVGLVVAAVAMLAAFADFDFTLRWLEWGIPALLIVTAATTARHEGRLSAGRLAEFVGDISYGLYLMHLFAIRFMIKLIEIAGGSGPLVWYVLFPAGVLVGTIVASTLLHYGFERPVLGALRSRFDRRITVGPGEAPAP